MSSAHKFIILTGVPGIGKTTLVKQCSQSIQEKGVVAKGFYTEEIRDKGKRSGFDIVTLDGQRAMLSRLGDDYSPQAKSEPTVGRYKVKLVSFENLAIPSINTVNTKNPKTHQLIVIDEIGKMELFSDSFVRAVRTVMKTDNVTMLATIPVARGKPIPFVEEIRQHKTTKLFEITAENRDFIKEDIVKALMEAIPQ